MEDSRIIELYFDRSEQALRETESKYGAYCGAIASNILSVREDAEECVNDTWLKAWNAIPPARPRRLRLFLGRITRNLALNRYEREHAEKRGGGQTEIVLEEMEECIADSGRGEWSCERAVLTDVLNRFLVMLPQQQRRVFVRRYWYMDSIKEIADAYGMGESRVKMILLRERKELAKMLMKEGIEP